MIKRPSLFQTAGKQISATEFMTPNGVVLPLEVVQSTCRRFDNPVQAPADLIPPSVLAGKSDGRVLHWIAGKQKAPKNVEDGQNCEFCANFRFEAGQEWIRRHGDPFKDDPRWGSRAPRAEDMGLCAVSDGECLTSRFWGGVYEQDPYGEPVRDESGRVKYEWKCPDFRRADSVTSTLDSRRGRQFAPLGDTPSV